MNLVNLVPLLGALTVLIGAVSPVLARWDKLSRLRRLNRAVADTPEGKGRDALVEARDGFAIRMSLAQLWIRPALLALLRNTAIAMGLVVTAGIVLESIVDPSWAPGWLTDFTDGGTSRALRNFGTGCYIAAGALQGWISGDRKVYIDNEFRRRLGIERSSSFWGRMLE